MISLAASLNYHTTLCRPLIEKERYLLTKSMAQDKPQLMELEDRILLLLTESTGMILDDAELVKTLRDSKYTAAILNDRVQESKKNEITINESREEYRSVATLGSILYFVVASLSKGTRQS
jgi:dynein heavy chain